MEILRYLIIVLGIFIAAIGLFHQFIVGGIVTRLKEADEKDLRIYLMVWVTHGAYVTLCGVLPAILLILYPHYEPSLYTTLFILSIATFILAVHIGISGLKLQIIPITIQFFSILIFSILLFIYYFFNQ